MGDIRKEPNRVNDIVKVLVPGEWEVRDAAPESFEDVFWN